MFTSKNFSVLALVLATGASLSFSQQVVSTTAPISVVPRLIKYAGALPSAPGKANTVDVTFALYAAPTGGEALWSEKQQVALDSAGRYSVLLGSVTALPSAVFATGEAKWIGVTVAGQEEAVRAALVATPYSLKASDAETLSGHPIADFALKNALPASGTNITQINVTNGVTGGGTGPTVTLGLSSTYLENLGDEIYPQLTGTNTLTGKNTYSAGKLFIGSSPVLSAANVTGTSPVTATVSGNTVKIGLSDSALLTLGNGVYAQLAAPDTFTAPVAVNASNPGTYAMEVNNQTSGTGYGIYGLAYSGGVVGFSSDIVTADSSVGVFGRTDNTGAFSYGVEGKAANAGLSSGVYGLSGAPSQAGLAALPYFGAPGIWADASQSGNPGSGEALFVTADDELGAVVINNSPTGDTTLYVRNDDTTGAARPLIVTNAKTNTYCEIDAAANFSCSGTFISAKPVEGRSIATYGVQSAESWIEDAGAGQLASGHAHVTLDPAFVGTVNTGVDYRVFLTPNGDSRGLYVTSKTPGSFDVYESAGGHSNITFDYRIMAKNKGSESVRLQDVTAQAIKARFPHGSRPLNQRALQPVRRSDPPRPALASTTPIAPQPGKK